MFGCSAIFNPAREIYSNIQSFQICNMVDAISRDVTRRTFSFNFAPSLDFYLQV